MGETVLLECSASRKSAHTWPEHADRWTNTRPRCSVGGSNWWSWTGLGDSLVRSVDWTGESWLDRPTEQSLLERLPPLSSSRIAHLSSSTSFSWIRQGIGRLQYLHSSPLQPIFFILAFYSSKNTSKCWNACVLPPGLSRSCTDLQAGSRSRERTLDTSTFSIFNG